MTALAKRPAGAARTRELHRNVMQIACSVKPATPISILENRIMMVGYLLELISEVRQEAMKTKEVGLLWGV